MTGPAGPSRVTVLLATRNGKRYLPEQLRTVLDQTGVRVTVLALDDMSTDGTFDWLQEQAATDPRVLVLPRQGESGGAAANFYRLLAAVDLDAADFVAFADQDDVWLPGKLAAQVAMSTGDLLDGVSCNVTAFGADGSRNLIKKDHPQRQFDYLLESPGPGCTFLFSPRLARRCRDLLADPDSQASSMDFHDWLVYGVCRAAGWSWQIGADPLVDYRQHADNAFGANSGVSSAVSRLGLIRQKWHRGEAIKMALVARQVTPVAGLPALDEMLELLQGKGIGNRIRLARRAGRLRRRPRDRALIGALILLGIW